MLGANEHNYRNLIALYTAISLPHRILSHNDPPTKQANYCWALMGLWAGSIGAFAVTLRDRRLISRTAEMVMVGAPFAGFLLLIAKSCAMCADGLDMLRFTLDPLFVAHLFAQAYGIVG